MQPFGNGVRREDEILLGTVLMFDLSIIGAAAFLLTRRENEDFVYADLNPACEGLTGLRHDLVVGHSAVHLFGQDTGSKIAAFQKQCAETKAQVNYETVATVPRGTFVYQSSLTPIIGSDGTVETIFGVTSDITERKRLENELNVANLRLNLALEALGGAHWFFDARKQQFELSPAFDTLLGAKVPRTMSLKEWQGHIHEDDRADTCFADLLAGRTTQGSAEFRVNSGGEMRWVRCRRKATLDTSGVAGIVGIVVDITSEKRQQADLSRLATTDGLTGLANRRRLDEWLGSKEPGDTLSLLMIDVDHFKRFNDIYGHVAGDAALKKVAEVLHRAASLHGGLAARYGGEEFLIVLPDRDETAASRIAEMILHDMEGLLVCHAGCSSGRLSVSIGAATADKTSPMKPSSLVALADQALYHAKDAGRSCYRVFKSLSSTRSAA